MAELSSSQRDALAASTDETLRARPPEASERPTVAAPSEAATRVAGAGAPPRSSAPLEGRIGRHHILGVLGSGGMGAVYDAYDPELDRRLAIKVLLGEVEPEQLLAEAQAMARVSHPNVVPVYDVGTHQGRVYMAMERLEGGTLASWLAAESRPWSEIVARFVAAGRGLAAAHATGLIHLDFKPENVLLDLEGRPRVVDFGIAQLSREAKPGPPPSSSASLPTGQRGSLLAGPTDGRIAGTPAYMAPEQFSGTVTDARTDQFAFCVALYEALAGRRPFGGTTVVEMATATLNDEAAPLPTNLGMPRWVARALARGLAKDPAERFASMDALLAELDRDPHRTRKRVMAAGALLGAAGLAGGLATWGTQRAASCSGAAAQLEGIWDPDRATQIATQIESTKLPYAADTAARVRTRLDAYATQWSASYEDNCEATNLRKEQSSEAMDLRLACLQRARLSLQASSDLLAEADAAVVERAIDMVDALPALARCEDLEGLTRDEPLPAPEIREQVFEVRSILARAHANATAGRFVESEALTRAALEMAEPLDFCPLTAGLTADLGSAQLRLKHHDEALELADRAIEMAGACGQWRTVRGAGELRWVLHTGGLANPVKAEADLRWFSALVAYEDTPEARLRLAEGRTALAFAAGDYPAAVEAARDALAKAIEVDGPEGLPAVVSRGKLGRALKRAGDYPAAAAELELAARLLGEHKGPEHPSVVTLREVLAELHTLTANYQAAADELEWVAARQRAVYGDKGVAIIKSLSGLAAAYGRLGDHDKAIEYGLAAIAADDGSTGARGMVANAYNNLGNTYEFVGRLDDALEAQRAALAIQIERYDPQHPTVAITRSAIGLVEHKLGDDAASLESQRAALAVLEAKMGADHPTVASVRSNLGMALAGLGRDAEALEAQRTALAVVSEKLGEDHELTIEIHGLVRALEEKLGG